MSRVLVTGGGGFLGSSLIKRLLCEGHTVVAPVRELSPLQNYSSERLLAVFGDITKPETLKNAFEHSISAVFHCAALSTIWGKESDFMNVNYWGTKTVVDLCLEFKVPRLIYVSSPSIYSGFENRTHITEESMPSFHFINSYAKSKYLSEDFIKRAHLNGLETFTIRPRAIYGPGDKSVFPRILKIAGTGRFPLLNEGKTLVELTYVEDVVSALLLCLEAPVKFAGSSYNVTSGEALPLKELLNTLFSQLNLQVKFENHSEIKLKTIAIALETIYRSLNIKSEPAILPSTVAYLGYEQTFNIEKIKTELKYQPQYGYKEGIEKFAEWWKEKRHAR